MARIPSSHGSLDGEAPAAGVAADGGAEGDEDEPFDSDEFREFLRERRERPRRSAEKLISWQVAVNSWQVAVSSLLHLLAMQNIKPKD